MFVNAFFWCNWMRNIQTHTHAWGIWVVHSTFADALMMSATFGSCVEYWPQSPFIEWASYISQTRCTLFGKSGVVFMKCFRHSLPLLRCLFYACKSWSKVWTFLSDGGLLFIEKIRWPFVSMRSNQSIAMFGRVLNIFTHDRILEKSQKVRKNTLNNCVQLFSVMRLWRAYYTLYANERSTNTHFEIYSFVAVSTCNQMMCI